MKCPSCGAAAAGKFCSSCGAALESATCAACAAPLTPGARFCHACGTPMGARSRAANAAPWAIAGVAAAAVVILAVLAIRKSPPAPPTTAGLAAAPASDISNMSPRERADRLFNRIMAASERGDTGEVRFFQAMALQSYAMLGDLDADARYHVALIEALSGNPDGALAQADSLERAAPTHLFGAVIRATVAHGRNEAAPLRRAYRVFLDRYDREMASGRQEYEDHRTALESFREEARSALGLGKDG